MTDATREAASQPLPASAAPDAAALQTPGALLQHERVRRGLSVQQSAEGLHLDRWIVEALESNQFLALGAPVYAKGYLRKYATLLGLAPDVVIARYEALSDTPEVPTPIPVITTTPPPRPRWPKYLAWTVAGAAAIGIGVLAFNLLMPPPAATTGAPAVIDAPVTAIAVEATPAQTQVSTAPDPDRSPLDRSPSAAGAGAQEPPNAARPGAQELPRAARPGAQELPSAAGAGAQERPPAIADSGPPVRVRLEFSEASWVEVYDAAGQRLLYDIGQPERPRVVSGRAPLNVVVGLAAAVNVQVNDQPIVVPRRANKDSTRFRVNADGSVQ